MHGKLYKNAFKLTVILFTLLFLCCDDVPKDKAAGAQNSAITRAISWDTATTITIKDLIFLLGKSVDSLPDINGYEKEKKEIKDTFETELITSDEWKRPIIEKYIRISTFFRVEYKYQNKLIFVVESDILKIERDDGSVLELFKTERNDDSLLESKVIVDSLVKKITLFTDDIKEGDVYVGQTFGYVRNLIKDKFVATKSELVFAILDEYPEIKIGFDISKIPSKDSLYSKHRMIGSLMEIPDSSKIQSIEIVKLYQDIVLLPDEVKSIELSNVSDYNLWGDGNISLDNDKKISFLEDFNKLQFSFLSSVSGQLYHCYGIKICCKNNEEIFLEQFRPYLYVDFKKKVAYISRENLVTKYWSVSEYNLVTKYWDVYEYEYRCNYEKALDQVKSWINKRKY